MRSFWFFFLAPLSLFALSLQEAETTALQNHPHLKSLEMLVDKAQQGTIVELSHYLPQLSFYSGAFKTQKPIKLLGLTEPSAYLSQLTLTQTLFSSPLYYKIKMAKLVETQFDFLLQAAKNDILYETRRLYYLVVLDQHKLRTAEENIRLLENLTKRMEAKYAIGQAIPYNVSQAKVALSNTTQRYYQTLKHLKSDQDKLLEALGFDPAHAMRPTLPLAFPLLEIPELAEKIQEFEKRYNVTTYFEEIVLPEEEFVKWEEVANEKRPDIQLSKTIVSTAKEAVRSHLAEYLPTLSFTGNYGGASTPFFYQPTDTFHSQQFQWGVGVTLNWNVFDGLGREARIKEAKAGLSSTKYSLKNVEQTAHGDVRNQLYAMQQAFSQYFTAKNSLKLAEENLKLADSELEIGYITIYDYLISVDGLIVAQTAFDEGAYELMNSYYALLHACGKE